MNEHGYTGSPERTHATALTPAELARILGSSAHIAPALRAIHEGKGVLALPERVEGISSSGWKRILEEHPLPRHELLGRHQSSDGTMRLLVSLEGAKCETVIIPSSARTTICVSSQAGCTRACRFCATAGLPFARNLHAGEIVLQVLLARLEAENSGFTKPENVVFMGMGEPLDNLDEVVRSIEVLTAAPAPGIAPRRITVSTSGVLGAIKAFATRSPAELALSLHATRDEDRERLVPHGKASPLRDLLAEAAEALSPSSRLLFVEYLLIGGVNDKAEDAFRLAELLRDIPCRVNLIPYNPVPDLPWAEPDEGAVPRFMSVLSKAGIRTLPRTPRGRDVGAACGQLAGSP